MQSTGSKENKNGNKIKWKPLNQKDKKPSDKTKNMMKQRRVLQSKYDTNLPKLGQNENITKATRRRTLNSEMFAQTIEENKSWKS